MHEFHSLSPDPFHAGERGGSGWLLRNPASTLEPIPDAPEPANNRALRLTQMRDLARRFSSQVQRENSKWEMRMLTQPIYRYEIADENSAVVDGAVFAFVWTAGTDPGSAPQPSKPVALTRAYSGTMPPRDSRTVKRGSIIRARRFGKPNHPLSAFSMA